MFPDNSGCYTVVLEPLSWAQSQMFCLDNFPGSHLLVISNAAQSNAVTNYTKKLDGDDASGQSYKQLL